MQKGNFAGEGADYCEVYWLSAVSCAKKDELIQTQFGMWTRVAPKKHVLDAGAYWCYLAKMTEPSMCGCNAAFLSNYFDHLFNCPSSLKVAPGQAQRLSSRQPTVTKH